MAIPRTLLVVSDLHYAAAAEKARGWREPEIIENRWLRLGVQAYRYFIWRRDPFAHNYLLDRFLAEAPEADYVVANGDFACDTAFVGVSDDAAFQSADECLAKLRRQFGGRLLATIGDHELGKRSLFGGHGGMRLASWERTIQGLGLDPFWKVDAGGYVLMGVASSLVALPVYLPETLPEERSEWERLRQEQMNQIRGAFEALESHHRVLLFCHDPTALPFLWREPRIRSRVGQISRTIIGHLHSRLFLWPSRILAGMPEVSWFGYSIRRMSAALGEARLWKPFRPYLCPAITGIQLLKDGGYCRVEMPEERGQQEVHFHPLPW